MDIKRKPVPDDTVRLRRSLQTVSRCNRELFQARGEQELLQSICQILVETAQVDFAWVGYCEDDDEQTVRPVASAGNGADYLERVHHSFGLGQAGQGPVGQAIRTGKCCWVKDIRTDPIFSHARAQALARAYLSCVALPLVVDAPREGRLDLRGALTLYANAYDLLDESEVALYAELASHLACTIGRLRGHLADHLSDGVSALLIRGERKRVEEALQSSEDRLRLVINTIPAVAWSALPDGSCAFVNQRWSDYTGLSAKDSAGWGWHAAFHPDDVGNHMEKWRASLATGQPFENEARLQRAADGEYRWFLIHGSPLHDESGKIVRWYGTATDIEERKQAQEALRDSEERWRAVFEHNPTMYFVVDAADTVLAVNPFGASQLGYSVGELAGRSVLNTFHEADRPLVQRNRAICLERLGQPMSWEARKLRKDGTLLWVRATARAMSIKARPVILITCEDVTDRRRAEYLTQQVFQHLPDLVGILGTDYRFRRANPTYEQIWRIPLEKIIGMHISDVFGREIFERVSKPKLDRCFAGEEVSYAGWFDNHPGGRKYWFVTYSPLRLDSERVDAALVVGRDLTEQMLASEKFHDAQIQLAHANRVATIGHLTASIAHEVNQPVGALVTNAHAALRLLRAEPPDLKQACEALDDIIKDGRRGSDVIHRIRALAKKVPPRPRLLDVNEAVMETLSLTRGEILRNGVLLQTQLARDLPPIRGDRVQLQQVVMNLVMNAVEAMNAVDDGTRELQIGTGKVPEDTVSITVRDSGPPLKPENLDRFFEAFYSTKPTGMGMGLAICRSIIEAHGGRIWATANVARGATLHVALPASAN